MNKKRVKAGTSKVTPQQEIFCHCIIKGMNQSDAYRKAFPKSLKWKDNSVNIKASLMAATDKVRIRIAELRAPVIAKAQYGLEQAMGEAQRAMALAESKEQAGAMVQAVALRSKLNGLLVEDRKNERRPLQEVEEAELDRVISQSAHDAGVKLSLH